MRRAVSCTCSVGLLLPRTAGADGWVTEPDSAARAERLRSAATLGGGPKQTDASWRLIRAAVPSRAGSARKWPDWNADKDRVSGRWAGDER